MELTAASIAFEGEVHLPVFCKEMPIGSRRVDFLVGGQVLVELKATAELTLLNYAQVINHLKAYRLEVALLINFGESSLTFKRFVHNPSRPTAA